MNQSCRVCGEVAAGYHFGAFTCEGCKSFFGRTYNNRSSIGECKNSNQCIINKKNRTSCKSCRLKKCFSVGMSKSGSRYGRRSNWFKIHCLLQDQGLAMQTQQQQQQSQVGGGAPGHALPGSQSNLGPEAMHQQQQNGRHTTSNNNNNNNSTGAGHQTNGAANAQDNNQLQLHHHQQMMASNPLGALMASQAAAAAAAAANSHHGQQSQHPLSHLLAGAAAANQQHALNPLLSHQLMAAAAAAAASNGAVAAAVQQQQQAAADQQVADQQQQSAMAAAAAHLQHLNQLQHLGLGHLGHLFAAQNGLSAGGRTTPGAEQGANNRHNSHHHSLHHNNHHNHHHNHHHPHHRLMGHHNRQVALSSSSPSASSTSSSSSSSSTTANNSASPVCIDESTDARATNAAQRAPSQQLLERQTTPLASSNHLTPSDNMNTSSAPNSGALDANALVAAMAAAQQQVGDGRSSGREPSGSPQAPTLSQTDASSPEMAAAAAAAAAAGMAPSAGQDPTQMYAIARFLLYNLLVNQQQQQGVAQ